MKEYDYELDELIDNYYEMLSYDPNLPFTLEEYLADYGF